MYRWLQALQQLEACLLYTSKRLADIKGRGVVLKKWQTLETLFEERSKLYEQYADSEVSEEGLDVEQTVEKLVDALEL